MLNRAATLLRDTFGLREFRPLQRQVIDHALRGRDVLAVLPTGGGKSLCFQVPALTTSGLTLVVSPLIALMQDQVMRLNARGVSAGMIGGPVSGRARDSVVEEARTGRLRLLYLSPEMLEGVAPMLASGLTVRRIAVDEAHCVVEWGYDFRPSYRRIRAASVTLGRPQCLAMTATATPSVRSAIRESLGMAPDTVEVVGHFDRPNLRFEVIGVHGSAERLSQLVVMIRTCRSSAIVYAPTRGLVDGLTKALTDSGVSVAPYHAGMTQPERRRTLDRFLADQIRVVVATSAFGMGIDKPDVRLVVHWAIPATPEAYYQEAGRAGRDELPARCVLFYHPTDTKYVRQHLATTFPDERLVERVWSDPGSRRSYTSAVLQSVDRLADELRPDRGRVDWRGVRRRRREADVRLRAMIEYASARRCRRALLLSWFGCRPVSCSGCDYCDRPTGSWWSNRRHS